MSQNDGIEPPIYIESFGLHRRHWYTATNGDAVHRFPVRLPEIWNQYDEILNTPDPGLINDGDVDAAGVVELYKSRALALQPGTSHKYALDPAEDLANVVTATFGLDAPEAGSAAPTLSGAPGTGYTPVIEDANGRITPMQASVWVVDGVNHFVEFPYGVPPEMAPPFALTFYRYIGLTGGGGGGEGAHVWHYAADVSGTTLAPDPAFVGAVSPSDWVAPLPAQSTEGAGTRIMFDQGQAAVRGGEVTGAQWDSASRGLFSVAFGLDTVASGAGTAVGGGEESVASGAFSAVGGGGANLAAGEYGFIGGGSENGIGAAGGANNYNVLGGGLLNTIGAVSASSQAAIVGGSGNAVEASDAFIGGGVNNSVEGAGAVIVGGGSNTVGALALQGGVVCGEQNQNGGEHSLIGGGTLNILSRGESSVICAGEGNGIIGDYNFVGGGLGCALANVTSHSVLGGGESNIIGGSFDPTPSSHHVLCGGFDNAITAVTARSFLGGGALNEVSAPQLGTLCGGAASSVSGEGAFVGGGGNSGAGAAAGEGHVASGGLSFIGGGGTTAGAGGQGHVASGLASAVCSGLENAASGRASVVGGGESNTASGDQAVVPGGDSNTASGAASFAAGAGSTAGDANSFVWSDSTPRASTAADQVVFGAAGGFQAFVGTKGGGTEFVINGDLTVTGLIDPPGVLIDGRAAVPEPAPAAGGGGGTYWVSNAGSPSRPFFTDDGGDSYQLAAEGVVLAAIADLEALVDAQAAQIAELAARVAALEPALP